MMTNGNCSKCNTDNSQILIFKKKRMQPQQNTQISTSSLCTLPHHLLNISLNITAFFDCNTLMPYLLPGLLRLILIKG